MIILRKYNNTHISFYINGSDFYPLLNIVRDIESREWNRHIKSWIAPINSITNFLSLLSKSALKTIIVWNIDVVNLYKKYKEYHSEIKKISELPVDTVISGYNEYITTKEKLMSFQTIGSHFLYTVEKACLADVVGLGKTVQSVIAAEKSMKEKGVYNVFAVVPASLKIKWKYDIEKFLGEGRCIIIDGNLKERKLLYRKYVNKKNIFIIMNYDIARNDWNSELFPFLEKLKVKRAVIYDEIQYLKNNKTQRSMMCRKLSKYCDIRFGLSATLIETSLIDIFNVFLNIDDTVLGSSSGKFVNRHVITDFWGKIIGYKNLEEITENIKYAKIRRHKEEVIAQLPERLETTYWCPLTKEQQDCYNDVQKSIINNITTEFRQEQISNSEIMNQIGFLIQVCLHTEMLDYKVSSSAKLNLLLDILENQLSEEKVVIFCFYKKMLEIIGKTLIDLKYSGVVVVHGDNTNKEQRHEIITKFNDKTSDEYKILVTSDVLRVGVDLIGSNYLIDYDLLWNPASMEQRHGRIDRIGQTANKVNIMYLLTENTVEQKMWQVLHERNTLANQILDDSKKVGKRVQRKDLLYIAGVTHVSEN